LISLRLKGRWTRVASVCSTRGRPFSPAATSAQRIWPDSIIAPATARPFKKPRQALDRSKICAVGGRPIR
jgi:hypothetical protein